ncbi:hypothetical protein THTE_1043 [Thermogutta terrifontis]|uniref:Uncharacterized protein n=1 Tax=Thermogutta terrifontis TaxID=1331910 RepID=A0A286RCG0_9BACT|nr:hypothetical protein THTE_1043 [Thermogutta terrifontis]
MPCFIVVLGLHKPHEIELRAIHQLPLPTSADFGHARCFERVFQE